jgi:uncharacterized protein
MSSRVSFSLVVLVLILTVACQQNFRNVANQAPLSGAQTRTLPADAPPALKQMLAGAIEQPGYTFYYDPAYIKLEYPGGDVPLERGVCTDVLIRAFRKGGVDLQKEIHEDMKGNFNAYPTKWGLTRPDSNIDHRRVPNLMTYFKRHGKAVPINSAAEDYKPGDVVAWDLGEGVDHIGILTNLWSPEARQFLIVHNIGAGARIENVLFSWHITGHYRYF